MSDEKRRRDVQPSADLSWREVNGELVAVHTRSGEYHVFNAVGTLVWAGILEGKDTDAIVSSIVDRHDVAASIALRDVEEFVDVLTDKGLLEKRVGSRDDRS